MCVDPSFQIIAHTRVKHSIILVGQDVEIVLFVHLIPLEMASWPRCSQGQRKFDIVKLLGQE